MLLRGPISENSAGFDGESRLTCSNAGYIFQFGFDQAHRRPVLQKGFDTPMPREPILTRTGHVILPAIVLSFAVIVSARVLGYENSVLGTLGVLIVTHIISGIANAILEYRHRQEAYYAELDRIRRWQESQPDPFGPDASEDQTTLDDRIKALLSGR